MYQENTSDKWDIPWYTTRKRCITILYLAIKNTVANTINETYAQCMMGRLGVIPMSTQWLFGVRIDCILYGMV